MVDKAHKAIENIRSMKTNLKKFQSNYADNEFAKDLIEESKSIVESIDKIENELYQTKNQSNQDPLNYGVKLTNNLGNLNSGFRGGDFGPTAQDIEVKNELVEKVNTQLTEYNSIMSNDVLGINTERFLVLNVDDVNDTVRVKREFDGVLGTAHTSTSLITSLNRNITFNLGINTDIQNRVNIPYYFNPSESVAIGTASGVGIGSTISYSYRVIGGGSVSYTHLRAHET